MKGKFSGLCKPLCDGLFAFCSVKEISRSKLGSYRDSSSNHPLLHLQ
jgi:hypothetical protein